MDMTTLLILLGLLGLAAAGARRFKSAGVKTKRKEK